MFSGLKFRGKLAMAIVPAMIALAVLAWAAVAPRLQRSSQAADDVARIEAASIMMEFFDETQIELGLSARFAGNPAVESELAEQRTVVEDRSSKALAALDRLDLPESSKSVDEFRAFAQSLPDIRSAVDSNSRGLGVEATVAQYDEGVDASVTAIRDLTRATDDADLLRQSNAIVSQLTGKAEYGEMLALIAGLLEEGPIDPNDVEEIEEDAADATASYAEFAEIASASDVALLREVEADTTVAQLDGEIEKIVINASGGLRSEAVATNWWASSVVALAAYDRLDDQMFANYRESAEDARSSSQRSAFLYLALALLASLTAAGVAYLVGRDLVRRVRQITTDAHTVAFDRLPEVLEALRNPTPEALAGALPQVLSPSKDEIGSIAESFNAVLRTSVETSIEHSTKRAETLTNVLVNLGRRNQAIIERQLELIDTLESNQQDPELLEGLFKLDHMVTRQRRNAESLLVLAGSRRSRAWTSPVPSSDVIQGAISEVADMGRVSLEMPAGHDLMVSGQHAVDLSHLLAELIENATLYSNPATTVVVRAQRSGMNLRMWVIDNGVGMGDDEIEAANLRVSDPPDIDEITTDQVGFQVVGRLARRLDARVRLQNNPAGGVAVSIDLPPSVFDTAQDDSGNGDSDAPISDEILIADHGDDFNLDDLSADDSLDREFDDLMLSADATVRLEAPDLDEARAGEPALALPTAAQSGPPAATLRRGPETFDKDPLDEVQQLPRRRTEVSTIPEIAGERTPTKRPTPQPVARDAAPSKPATTPPARVVTVPTARTNPVQPAADVSVAQPQRGGLAAADGAPEQTAAGLVKRRPGAAMTPQREVEPIGLFKSGEADDLGDDALAEARLKSLRAFTRGVDQGRGDAK